MIYILNQKFESIVYHLIQFAYSCLFVDHKIPKMQRQSMPVICSGKGIIWVAGCGISDWAKVIDTDGSALKLVATEISIK